jgi:hypothetical protein
MDQLADQLSRLPRRKVMSASGTIVPEGKPQANLLRRIAPRLGPADNAATGTAMCWDPSSADVTRRKHVEPPEPVAKHCAEEEIARARAGPQAASAAASCHGHDAILV